MATTPSWGANRGGEGHGLSAAALALVGMAVVVALVKIVGDVASGVIEAMEEEDDGGGWEGDMDI